MGVPLMLRTAYLITSLSLTWCPALDMFKTALYILNGRFTFLSI